MRRLRHCLARLRDACTVANWLPRSPRSGDVAGARDYPGIGRFAGSVITGYQVKDFDAARLQAAAFKDGKPADARRLEGRITRIAYRTNPGPSILEVSRNFETQLAKAGFETLSPATPMPAAAFRSPKASTRCRSRRCGSTASTIAISPAARPRAGARPMRPCWSARTTTTSMPSSTVAVVGAIENKMVDAGAMAKGLREKGHIALYGIYFDTDKAVIKPESRPTLDEIAKLLRAPAAAQRGDRRPHRQPGRLRLQHGPVAPARRGGRGRARATYKIAAARLRTAGVGFLAPVGSNASDDGRALNRRVELVAP